MQLGALPTRRSRRLRRHPMHAKKLWISCLTATLVIACLPPAALAGTVSWPQRTVRVIVPFAALVAAARAQPGKLNYYAFNGGSFAILLPGFAKSLGLDMVQVNYRESSLGIQDLIAGRIHLMMSSLLTSLPLAQSGKVRLL